MTQDHAYGYWFTTSGKGVFYSPNLDFQLYDERSGLSDSYISTFEVKDDNSIFVGLQNGDIFKLNRLSHVLQKLPTLKSYNPIFTEFGITALFYDKKENVLWAGNPFSYFSDNSWKSLKYTHPTFKDKGDWPIKKLINSQNINQIWITSSLEIAKLDFASKTFKFFLGFRNLSSRIFSCYEDKHGQLWVGRADGLWKLQEDTIVPPQIMHPSFYHRIEAIQQLPDSTFVIGTKGRGIILWKDTSFMEITETDGLTSSMIENIYVDEKGAIWVGTLMGLNKVTIQKNGTFSIKRITIEHGLPSNEINHIEVIDDEVWVATTKGLVRFPYNQPFNLVSHAPFFENVLIKDKMIDWENSDSTFSHRQNNISFEFLTINYRQNGQIPYRYRLLPVQKIWKETQNRLVSFPALDKGDFNFEVQSQNEDGVWSDSTCFRFTILPAWWETWWTISSVFLVIIIAGFGIYKKRTRHLKNEITLQKRITEIERQALRSQMNPHFIFNALNAIQGYIAEGDKLAANRFLSRFSKLIRAALQHSQMTKVPLQDDLASLNNYLELEQMRFNGSFDYNINLAEVIDVEDFFIPTMLVQPFVENAIIHGISKIEKKGQIDIDFHFEDAMLLVTVIDNGIGIETSKKMKAGITSSHKSLAMSLTKRRMDMLDGKPGKGSIEVKELKDDKGKTIGTKVTLQIPLDE